MGLFGKKNKNSYQFTTKEQLEEDAKNGVDLKGISLHVKSGFGKEKIHVDISEINLENVDLSNANLSVMILEKANLQKANLTNVNFKKSLLTEINLQGANLTNTNFSFNFDNGSNDYQGARLLGANLSNSKLSQTNFDYADLRGADLSNTDFTNSPITSHTQTCGTNFSGSNLSEKQMLKMDFGILIYNFLEDGVNQEQGQGTCIIYRTKKETKKIWIENPCDYFRITNLSGANFTNTDLSYANLIQANFSGANLSGANMSYSTSDDVPKNANDEYKVLLQLTQNLPSVDFTNADLNGAKLEHVKLKRANFSGANLSGAKMKHSDFRGANFSGANLSGAQLYSADLRGANLEGAILDGADTRKAKINEPDDSITQNENGESNIHYISKNVAIVRENIKTRD
jgi:uncharacterized protein YjbI with pentapeptide repeats